MASPGKRRRRKMSGKTSEPAPEAPTSDAAPPKPASPKKKRKSLFNKD